MLVTVGHGTLAADDFLGLLRDAVVEELVDVRSPTRPSSCMESTCATSFHDERLVGHEPARELRLATINGEEVVVYDVGVDRPLFGGEADVPNEEGDDDP